MNNEEQNVETLRAAYQMWSDTKGAAVEHWLNLMADDVQMGSLADGNAGMEFSQARTGKQQATQYFAQLSASWEMISFVAEEFIAQGDRVVMVGRCAFRSRSTGKTAESQKADIVRFRDGKIIEYMEFYDTAKAYAAATP